MRQRTGDYRKVNNWLRRYALAGFLLLVALSVLLSWRALAEEAKVISTPSDCSINLSLAFTDSKTNKRVQLTGGQVTVYKVSDALEINGDKLFDPQISGQFQTLAKSDSEDGKAVAAIRGYDSAELTSRNATLAQTLYRHLSEAQGQGTSANIGSTGSVTVGSLTPGLYLMVQTQDSPEKAGFDPFLFSLPDPDGNYRITASPKPEVLGEIEGSQTEPSTEKKKKPKTSDGGTPGGGSRLPQTGQLWWPVPILLLAGLLLAAAGLAMRKKAEDQES